jgi:coniferyl-aldehyde dehydrogenase
MNQPFENPPFSQAGMPLAAIHQRLRSAWQRDPYPSRTQRHDWLERLVQLTERHGDELVAAISADFGHRSAHETRLAELTLIVGAARHAQRHLRRWMKPRRMATALQFMPSWNRLMYQPVGVVGVVAPWNYPHQLAFGPAIAALAAGNRVMLKPSEYTPRYAALLARLVPAFFSSEEMVVVTGDSTVAQAFTALPFDHLVFTGSTATGRHVAMAAARNLTPVTLELGGKSPAIIDASADLEAAAASLVFGKLVNAGQTCVAPDYLLVPAAQRDALVDALRKAAARMYPTLADNPDYSAIINRQHMERLQRLQSDAETLGARLVPLGFAERDEMARAASAGKLAPMLVLDTAPVMRIMQEEIFGPLLPILTYSGDVGEAIAYVNRGDRPLALYWYGTDSRNCERVLRETVSGGVTINDCLWHLCQESQPFGGAGASGMGAYHGEWGFRAFSQEKPVFYQSRLSGVRLLHPPYGRVFEGMLRLLRILA